MAPACLLTRRATGEPRGGRAGRQQGMMGGGLALRRLKMATKRRNPREAGATGEPSAGAAGLLGSGRALFVLALFAAVGCGIGNAESVFSKENTTSPAGGSGGAGGAGATATGVGGTSSASTGGPPD